jgi:hypothetical protein
LPHGLIEDPVDDDRRLLDARRLHAQLLLAPAVVGRLAGADRAH